MKVVIKMLSNFSDTQRGQIIYIFKTKMQIDYPVAYLICRAIRLSFIKDNKPSCTRPIRFKSKRSSFLTGYFNSKAHENT